MTKQRTAYLDHLIRQYIDNLERVNGKGLSDDEHERLAHETEALRNLILMADPKTPAQAAAQVALAADNIVTVETMLDEVRQEVAMRKEIDRPDTLRTIEAMVKENNRALMGAMKGFNALQLTPPALIAAFNET